MTTQNGAALVRDETLVREDGDGDLGLDGLDTELPDVIDCSDVGEDMLP